MNRPAGLCRPQELVVTVVVSDYVLTTERDAVIIQTVVVKHSYHSILSSSTLPSTQYGIVPAIIGFCYCICENAHNNKPIKWQTVFCPECYTTMGQMLRQLTHYPHSLRVLTNPHSNHSTHFHLVSVKPTTCLVEHHHDILTGLEERHTGRPPSTSVSLSSI